MGAGFTSGLNLSGLNAAETGARLYAVVDGVADGKATLEAPFTLETEVIEHKVVGPSGQERTQLIPGRGKVGALSLRRPFHAGGANEWFLLWQKTKEGRAEEVPVSLVLEDAGGTARVTWDGAGRAFGYRQQVTRDGFPVEVIRFEFDSGKEPVRSATVGPEEPGLPGVGAPTFYDSGLNASHYLLNDGTPGVPGFVMPAGPGQDAAVIEHVVTGPSGGQIVRKLAGNVTNRSFVLRHHPLVANPFYFRYRQVVLGNINTARRTMDLSAIDTQGQTVFTDQLLNAWPRSYTLRPTDDGLAVEDTEFVYEDLTVQTSP